VDSEKIELLLGSAKVYDPATMALFDRNTRQTLDAIASRTSELLERIQRIAGEQSAIRANADRQLRSVTSEIGSAERVAGIIGDAIHKFAAVMRSPMPRGRAGGIARVKNAWRRCDGKFLPDSGKADAYFAEYERYAAGGRAIVTRAMRAPDGTFLPETRT
jgi:hypothetical protein